MYINYYQQRNIQLGQDYYTLKDLSNGTQKQIVQHSGSSFRVIWDFFKQASAAHTPIKVGKIETNGVNTSDIRIKENIKPITHHFDILDKSNPCKIYLSMCQQWYTTENVLCGRF